MVYFILGKNFEKSREKLETLVARFKTEAGDSLFFETNEDNFAEPAFNEFIKTGSLFNQRKIVVGRNLFTLQAVASYLLENLSKFSDSSDIFIFKEEILAGEILSCAKKEADEICEFEPAAGKEKVFKGKDIFFICDALALKQKHRAWLLFQEAVLKGTSHEEVFWKFFWQIKTLLVFKNEKGDGLKNYFFAKTKKAASLFTETELKKHSSNLVKLYHQSRYGEADLGVGLEKFLLKI